MSKSVGARRGFGRGAGFLARSSPTLLLLLCASAFADPPTPRGPDGEPLALEVTEFATGLSFPYGMALADDGSLLVGVSYPDGNFLKSEGAVVRLVDTDGDGVADGPPTQLIGGLVGVVTALARAGPFLLVTSAQAGAERIQVLRVGALPGDPLTHEGSVVFDFASGRLHASYSLAVRPSPAQPGAFDVFFNVGSTANSASELVEAPVSGLLAGTVLPDSLYRFVLRDKVAGPEASDLRHVARGLRNAAAIVFAPDGSLLITDNGSDREENKNEQFSADELNRLVVIDDAELVPDFGFPTGYVEYRTGAVIGGGLAPLHTFQPMGSAEAEGASSIAFTPRGFPAPLRDGVFVGFHGKFDDHGPLNEENPVLFASLDGQTQFPLLTVDEPQIAHINGLLATDDALYLSDLSGTGSLFVDAGATGVIYRVRAAPPEIGDANGDGRVDLADLEILAAHYLQPRDATVADGDFDGDGDVDLADLLLWATHFGLGTDDGRREPPRDALDAHSLALPGFNSDAERHVLEVTAPLSSAARDRHAVLAAQPDRTGPEDRDLDLLALLDKRQTKPWTRVREDFAKLRQAIGQLRKLKSEALPRTEYDRAFTLAERAVTEQMETAEDSVYAAPDRRAFRSVERRLDAATRLLAKAAAETNDWRRAGLLRKSFAKAESATKRGHKLLTRRDIDLPPERVRSGDLLGVDGARVAVSRAEDTSIAGASLVVPPAALVGLQTIQLTAAPDLDPVFGFALFGPAVHVEFADRAFVVPATLCIPADPPDGLPVDTVVLVGEDASGATLIMHSVSVAPDGTLCATIDGQGTFQLAFLVP